MALSEEDVMQQNFMDFYRYIEPRLLPDIGMISNEANILSTTEKAIGQWTDGKLLYQKVVDLGTLSNAMDKVVDVSGKSTMDVKYIYGEGYNSSGRAFFIPKAHDRGFANQLALQFDRSYGIEVYSRSGEFSGFSAFAVIQYTKTTDSPLPSDVKFAGVDENGNVVLKKTVTGTTKSSAGDVAVSLGSGLTGIMVGEGGVSLDNGHSYRGANLNNQELQVWVDGDYLYVYSNVASYYSKPFKYTVYFSLAS